MINRNTEREVRPSFIPKFSDPDIIKAVLSSDFWRHVFLGERKALWMFAKAIVLLKIEMFSSPLRMYLRYGHGRRTVGAVITLMSATMMMAFNTRHLAGALATFFPLAAPIVPFFMDGEELWYALFTGARSESLLYFWLGHLALSMIHLVRVYRRSGQAISPTGRGSSILYHVFKHMGISEHMVQLLAEPLLVGLAGYALVRTGADFTFGLFLLIAAACLFSQEGFDAVKRFSIT